MVNYEEEEQKQDQDFEAPLPFCLWRHVMVDADHCFFGIEGMDELARIKGVYEKVAAITKQGMEGLLPWGAGFAQRLAIVQPTEADMHLLTGMYRESLTPFAKDAVRIAQSVGVQVHIFSGGFAQAIKPVAFEIGIPETYVHANVLYFDKKGNYAGYDQVSPLARGRKDLLVERLRAGGVVAGSVAGIDDGLMGIHAVDGLRIGFGGYTSRASVQEGADVFLPQASFTAVLPLIIGRMGIDRIVREQADSRKILITGMRELQNATFNPRASHIQQEIQNLRSTTLAGA